MIFELYDTICRDDRNEHNHLLWDGAVGSRSFAGWSMAFLAPGDLAIENQPAYSKFFQMGLSQSLVPNAPHSIGKHLLLSLRDDFLGHQD